MLGADLLAELAKLEIVEIFEIAGGDADRTDGQPRLQIVDAVEIDQPLQRFRQRRRVVIAQRRRRARRPERRRRKARREEAGHTEGRDDRRTGLVEQRARTIALQDRRPRHRLGHHVPELLQPLDALVTLVAGDDRGVDGADRNTGDPFRLEIMVAQRLVGAGLIGTERTAALQHQHALRFCRRGGWRGRGTIHGGRPIGNNGAHQSDCWRRRQSARGALLSRLIYLASVDARISVQNTLYLVFGA